MFVQGHSLTSEYAAVDAALPGAVHVVAPQALASEVFVIGWWRSRTSLTPALSRLSHLSGTPGTSENRPLLDLKKMPQAPAKPQRPAVQREGIRLEFTITVSAAAPRKYT